MKAVFRLVKTGYLGFIYRRLPAMENYSPWVFQHAKGYSSPPRERRADEQGGK